MGIKIDEQKVNDVLDIRKAVENLDVKKYFDLIKEILRGENDFFLFIFVWWLMKFIFCLKPEQPRHLIDLEMNCIMSVIRNTRQDVMNDFFLCHCIFTC